MDYENIALEKEGALAIISLDRPNAFNALNLPLVTELADAIIEVDVDSEVRALMIRANGDAFCGGGDVKAFVSAGEGLPKLIHQMTINLHGLVSRLIRMQKPVVTAVNGFAAGAGFALAMAGDIVLAAESAKFTSAYTRIGASPDGSSTFFLSRVLGVRRALEFVYTNRTLTAAEALDWGMITRVIPDAEFAAQTREMAIELSQGPTLALGRAKDLIYHSHNNDLEAQMERETQYIVASSKTEDFHNATRAFVEKKPAKFVGR